VLLNEENINKEFVIQGIGLGISEEELISKLGIPSRKDLSKYCVPRLRGRFFIKILKDIFT